MTVVNGAAGITTLPYVAWAEPQDERQIVVSTRLRLARNLTGKSFPNRLSDAEAEQLGQEMARALPENENWQLLRLDELLERERGVLLEKHLLSRDILQHTCGRLLAVNAAQKALMIKCV